RADEIIPSFLALASSKAGGNQPRIRLTRDGSSVRARYRRLKSILFARLKAGSIKLNSGSCAHKRFLTTQSDLIGLKILKSLWPAVAIRSRGVGWWPSG